MSPYKKAKSKAKRILRVSLPMLHQMLAYCDWAKESGTYYGNPDHFRKRHNRIMKWLEAIRDRRLDHSQQSGDSRGD